MGTNTVQSGAFRHPTSIGLSFERMAALTGLGVSTLASMTILYQITAELGGTTRLFLHASVAIVLAGMVARYLTPRAAAALFVAIGLVSYLWFLFIVLEDLSMLIEAPVLIIAHTLDDAVSVATGQSVKAIVATDVWAHSFAPAPLFLTWYFGFRRRYAIAGGIAGATMMLFVLSGDLGILATLLGTIGVVMAIGFGTIELTGASSKYTEGLLVLITAMAVVALLIPLIPAGGAIGPLTILDSLETDDHRTLESSIVGAGDELEIIGEIDTNPEVRFLVEGDEPTYIRTGVYDYYTGSGWERTGETKPFVRGDVRDIEPNANLVRQNITALVDTDRMPSAGDVMEVLGIASSRVELTEHGSIFAPDGLDAGESYRVFSQMPHWPGDVEDPSTPDSPDERYLQLSEDVEDELHELTQDIIEGADNPHEKAQRITNYLRSSKTYSHDVNVPSGDLASGFVFDMEAGYCTYFATAMVVMLRSADIPSRLAVGYTSGQQLTESHSLVRGMNSHAWPEVYFEDHGWVSYEPTPPSEWSNFRDEILETAREEEMDNVDITASEGLPLDHNPIQDDNGNGAGNNETDPNGNESDPNGQNNDSPIDPIGPDDPRLGPADPDPGGDLDPDNFPDIDDYRPPEETDEGVVFGLQWEHLALIGALGLGAMASARRYRLPSRTRRELHMRWQLSRNDPVTDLTRSGERLEWALSKRIRSRRPGETLREYQSRYQMQDGDPTVDELFAAIERARYAGETDRALADRSVTLANEVVADTVLFGGRLLPSIPTSRGITRR